MQRCCKTPKDEDQPDVIEHNALKTNRLAHVVAKNHDPEAISQNELHKSLSRQAPRDRTDRHREYQLPASEQPGLSPPFEKAHDEHEQDALSAPGEKQRN